jgi:tRNA (guanine37-N1)-methyltransferase
MENLSQGIKVARPKGEVVRRALVELRLLDRGRRIRSTETHILLPILNIDQDSVNRLRSIADIEVIVEAFQIEKLKPNLEDLLGFQPGYEVVGDIAIVEPERAEAVASALMTVHRNIKTIISPISEVEGEFRTRRFRHIAGKPKTDTIHKEHGFCYHIDLGGAYFSPRLGTERLRVANQVKPSDFVLDMFAGVGPFALLIAQKGAKVVAIDKNPLAIRYLKENALLNKVDIEILEGDAAELALLYENKADHVIMNLPHMASQFLAPAIRAAKSRGIVHYYAFAPEDNLYRDCRPIEYVASSLGLSVSILHKGIVRSYAPRCYNVTVEFMVTKIGP